MKREMISSKYRVIKSETLRRYNHRPKGAYIEHPYVRPKSSNKAMARKLIVRLLAVIKPGFYIFILVTLVQSQYHCNCFNYLVFTLIEPFFL